MADETQTGRHERPEVTEPAAAPAPRRDRVEEVAARSADGSKGLTFRKVFVMGGEIPPEHFQHEANWAGTLQEALHRGLHPKGKVQLVDHEVTDPDRRGRVSTVATYEVLVEPASTDLEAHTTVAPSSGVAYEPVRS
jgi:hypothetical protein